MPVVFSGIFSEDGSNIGVFALGTKFLEGTKFQKQIIKKKKIIKLNTNSMPSPSLRAHMGNLGRRTQTPVRSYLSYFRPTKFKIHYVVPQFFIFRRTVQIAPNFLHWNAHIFLFWLNPTGHSKFHNTSNHPPPATDSGRTARTPLYPPVQAVPPYFLPPPLYFVFLSRTEESSKAGTRAHDRRALQQLALNVHVKHSDLTWPPCHNFFYQCSNILNRFSKWRGQGGGGWWGGGGK